jgi:imidazolonepropionase-like amidohydrolase
VEAIIASTKTSAEALGFEGELGTLEAGKLAGITIVNGDPLQDIGLLQDQRKIDAVMKAGHIVVL